MHFCFLIGGKFSFIEELIFDLFIFFFSFHRAMNETTVVHLCTKASFGSMKRKLYEIFKLDAKKPETNLIFMRATKSTKAASFVFIRSLF